MLIKKLRRKSRWKLIIFSINIIKKIETILVKLSPIKKSSLLILVYFFSFLLFFQKSYKVSIIKLKNYCGVFFCWKYWNYFLRVIVKLSARKKQWKSFQEIISYNNFSEEKKERWKIKVKVDNIFHWFVFLFY